MHTRLRSVFYTFINDAILSAVWCPKFWMKCCTGSTTFWEIFDNFRKMKIPEIFTFLFFAFFRNFIKVYYTFVMFTAKINDFVIKNIKKNVRKMSKFRVFSKISEFFCVSRTKSKVLLKFCNALGKFYTNFSEFLEFRKFPEILCIFCQISENFQKFRKNRFGKRGEFLGLFYNFLQKMCKIFRKWQKSTFFLMFPRSRPLVWQITWRENSHL